MTVLPAPSDSAGSAVQPDDKRRYVREIFSDIAPRYDLLNRLLSMNIDQAWRRAAVARLGWEQRPQGTYLDACAGTLDLSVALANRPGFAGRVISTDFALPMLRSGVAKQHGRPVLTGVADTLRLPLRDASCDGAMIGFGVRNLTSADEGMREVARVLKPGGRLVILDFTTPPRQPMRSLYLLYFRRILPVIGRAISGHPTAYSYLPASVMQFQAPAALEAAMGSAGFSGTGHQLLTGGIAAVTWGIR